MLGYPDKVSKELSAEISNLGINIEQNKMSTLPNESF